MLRRTTALAALLVLALTGCGKAAAPVSVKPPALGACRHLTASDLTHAGNETATVACTNPHTAETFAIGTLPATTGSSYDDRRHGTWIFTTCQQRFEGFLGVDDSLALRIQLSWAWFRPSKAAWAKGARWYRCDLVGGPQKATSLRELPTTGKGLFSAKPPEQWLTCANGDQVQGTVKFACSKPHTWRAVTTIKLGGPKDPYPGDRLVEVRTRDFCSDSVGAWLNYAPDYQFGYTYFHEAEWKAGNRRSICWAKTDR